jgi:hypothetical protein
MRRLASGLVGHALAAFFIVASLTPLNAAPLYLPTPTGVASTNVEPIYYYGHRCYHCGRRYYYRGYHHPYYRRTYHPYYHHYYHPYYRYHNPYYYHHYRRPYYHPYYY